MKRFLPLIVLLGFAVGTQAQTKDLGAPLGWSSKVPKLSVQQIMPGFDLAQAQFEDSINDANKVGPWRFGYEYSVDLGLDNSGEWYTLPGGDRLWRLNVVTPGALSQNFVFDEYELPEGAYLSIYPRDKSYYHNAYTSDNNNEARVLGSGIIRGEDVIIEYYEPQEVAGQGHLNLETIVHGYRNVNIFYDDMAKALNSSGDCNIDVLCPLGVGWENEVNSVAMIVSGGGVCTGALINNHRNDETPYFLTANHCGFSASWSFRFNWVSPNPSCATTTPSTDVTGGYDEINGCSLISSSSGSDFGLLQLNTSPPCTYTPYYAGWDATDNTTVTQATGIHHPSGDIMKICRESDAPYHASAAGAQVWYIDEWEQGVTEPGSSGSPLFDQDHRIIGQLYGGAAACSGTVNNGQYDYYGRLGVSWTGGGSSGTRLSDWLDPDGTGVLVNDGYDPCGSTLPDDAGISTIISPTASGTTCSQSLSAEVNLRNYGTNTLTAVNIIYDVDGGSASTYSWSGSLASGATEIVTLPAMTVSVGTHTFNVSTDSPNASVDTDPTNDDASTNFIVGANNIRVEITPDCWGSEITWTVTEQGGTQVYASGGPYADVPGTGGPTHTHDFCLPPGCFTFEILDSYGDGLAGNGVGSCTVDGDYIVTNEDNGNTLAEIGPDPDYGSGTSHDFCVTSVEEYNPLSNVQFFPNPTTDNLTVIIPFSAKGVQVELTDLAGKLLDVQLINSGATTVAMDELSSGMYLVRLQHEGYTITRKIQKL